jgi:hypothetical protein
MISTVRRDGTYNSRKECVDEYGQSAFILLVPGITGDRIWIYLVVQNRHCWAGYPDPEI